MRVLSLFDGIGCGKLALDRAGIKNIEYFASEIDTDALTVMKYRHRDAYVYGDVTKLNAKHFTHIDLLIGGSPCQSFSQAGSRKGFDGKSGLFWEPG